MSGRICPGNLYQPTANHHVVDYGYGFCRIMHREQLHSGWTLGSPRLLCLDDDSVFFAEDGRILQMFNSEMHLLEEISQVSRSSKLW